MVKRIGLFNSNGVKDFLFQRVSAIILGAYFVFLFIFCLSQGGLDYDTWTGLFGHTWVKLFSVLALISMMVHSWIGIWTVLTDYVKPTWLRGSLELIIILALVIFLIWGLDILWSV